MASALVIIDDVNENTERVHLISNNTCKEIVILFVFLLKKREIEKALDCFIEKFHYL
jgi:hypothetical protein